MGSVALCYRLQLGGNFCYEPEDMIRELEEESVDGPTHQCTLSPATQRMLRKCFKDIVRIGNRRGRFCKEKFEV